jgi:aryl-alcohol dehydrogenase
MSMLIDAAVLRSRDGPYSLEKVALAEPSEKEILVRVVAAGYCHTDVLPRSRPASILPLITGHEGAGIVEKVGPQVSNVAIGDHVVLTFQSCGECHPCQEGKPSYCDDFGHLNASGRNADGSTGVRGKNEEEISSRWFGQSSFATYAITTQRNTVVIDRDVPLVKMAPLGCGIQSGAGAVIVTFGMKRGESLAVFGAGSVGLSAVMAAHGIGASAIIAVDIHQHRLELARELGATHTFLGSDEGLVTRILEVTNGGVHYAFDTTGVPSIVMNGIAALRKTGTCGMVGAPTGDLVIPPHALNGKSLTRIVEGGVDPHKFIPELIALWKRGVFPFDRLIKTFPLSQINEAEEASLKGRVVKPVLLPHPTF